MPREDVRKGQFMIGAAGPPAEAGPKRDRSRIHKGMRLTSDAPGTYAKLGREFEHFEQQAAVADDLARFDQRHAAAVGQLVEQLQAVRAQIDDLNNKRGKKR